MEYPENFDTPALPAGRTLAVARAMGIASLVAFFIAVFLCVLIWWTARSVQLEPIVVRLNTENNQWSLVGHGTISANGELTGARAVQDAVIANFVINWFTISGLPGANDVLWSPCARDTCDEHTTYGQMRCALYCATNDETFETFSDVVVPQYRARLAAGERWSVLRDSISITEPRSYGGLWQVRATVRSNINGLFEIVAFVQLGRDGGHLLTNGYYIQDFNSYRISR